MRNLLQNISDHAVPVQSGRIWTVEGYGHIHGEEPVVDEEEAKLLLLEKEFEDFYEDQVIKILNFLIFNLISYNFLILIGS